MTWNPAAPMGRWSASHWKTATLGWLAFVVASVAVGAAIGTDPQKRRLPPSESDHRRVLAVLAYLEGDGSA